MNAQNLFPQSEINPTDLTRRSFLQGLGCLAAVAGLPLPAARAADATPAASVPVAAADATLITRLSTYMSEAASREISPEAAEKAKHHILDTLAAMVSGADLPPAVVALKFARLHAGDKLATVVGSDLLCGAMDAALVNGMLAHSDETDDSHAPSHTHPGCAIVPAALASGEHYGTSGTRLLRAVTLGYDIGTRITMALGGLDFQMETHHSTHSIGANFGAAAAAGCTAGFNAQQMCWLIDYAAQQAAGSAAWMRDLEHVSKSLVYGGRPAHNAIESVLMLELGATGVADILSGPDNFFIAMTPKADPSKLIEQLGERYEVTRTNIKKWTVGSPIQAPLDAIQNLQKRRPFEADEVRKVVVRVATSEAKTVNNRGMPDICMQHLVAVMILDKTVSFDVAHDKARMKDPAVLKVRAKVQLVPDEELERLYPERQAIVDLTLTDGTTLSERMIAVRGTAENPMPREEVVAKCRDLMAPRLGAEKCARLIESVLDLENIKDIRSLRPLLQRT
ncbi:MmgE/PrpD family protein [Opitutus sp. GAS368]|jgi:2-methylcitrate dehydratase PrpD|uniref:MmgE/PrpD family protein n=1 Tax=Opitutus sp. GAS368 TaxID=1882749 RepID=UPI00087AA4CA|nr:MmgE/PrpD family protein [Opitutus sp. GAS368]SDR68188.1 2-methylcitrate dehydratase PrpD [Opitutus sp. GAS368]